MHSEPPFHQNLALEYPSSSWEAKLKDERTSATKEATEQNMGLSVVVYIQLAASGDKIRLDGATNQFWLAPPANTRRFS